MLGRLWRPTGAAPAPSSAPIRGVPQCGRPGGGVGCVEHAGAVETEAVSGISRFLEAGKSKVPADRQGTSRVEHTSERNRGEGRLVQPEEQAERHVQRIAEAAAIEAAQALLQHGFDEARAEGADIVLRRGKTTWRVINRVRYEPGIRERVQDQFARFVVSNLVNQRPSTAHQP